MKSEQNIQANKDIIDTHETAILLLNNHHVCLAVLHKSPNDKGFGRQLNLR